MAGEAPEGGAGEEAEEAGKPGGDLDSPPPPQSAFCKRGSLTGAAPASLLLTFPGQPQEQWVRVSCLMHTSQTLSPQYQLQW